jgi:hypothetical protein
MSAYDTSEENQKVPFQGNHSEKYVSLGEDEEKQQQLMPLPEETIELNDTKWWEPYAKVFLAKEFALLNRGTFVLLVLNLLVLLAHFLTLSISFFVGIRWATGLDYGVGLLNICCCSLSTVASFLGFASVWKPESNNFCKAFTISQIASSFLWFTVEVYVVESVISTAYFQVSRAWLVILLFSSLAMQLCLVIIQVYRHFRIKEQTS